jgi:hypothetical protein
METEFMALAVLGLAGLCTPAAIVTGGVVTGGTTGAGAAGRTSTSGGMTGRAADWGWGARDWHDQPDWLREF